MTIVRVGDHWVVTVLPSGREVHAHPRDDQAETAAALGYGDDVAALTRDHDPIHTLLAEWLGAPASYALRLAAGDLPDGEAHLAELEEAAVIAVQRFAMHAGLMSSLRAMIACMDDDKENEARLAGLAAVVALPLVRSDMGFMRRVPVEVEVAPDRWISIEGMSVELGKLTVWSGTNGSSMRHEFSAAKCPRWRTRRPAPKFLVPGYEYAEAGFANS